MAVSLTSDDRLDLRPWRKRRLMLSGLSTTTRARSRAVLPPHAVRFWLGCVDGLGRLLDIVGDPDISLWMDKATAHVVRSAKKH